MINDDERRNVRHMVLSGPEHILENSKEFELDFINFDRHRLSNLTPETVGGNE